jgi:hypothetical protein
MIRPSLRMNVPTVHGAAQLKRPQDALGRLNDIEIHKAVARQVARRQRAASHASKVLAMGFVLGHEQTETEPCHRRREIGEALAISRFGLAPQAPGSVPLSEMACG